MKPLVVLLGVSGSGKSTVGRLLARELRVPFKDADDLHSQANLNKMAAGEPLDDDDRWPWLQEVGNVLSAADSEHTGLVIACSALKRSYRLAILAVEPRTRFVLLDGPREVLEDRLAQREGHFMPASLLDSQLATLEQLDDTEPGISVTIDQPAEAIALEVFRVLRSMAVIPRL